MLGQFSFAGNIGRWMAVVVLIAASAKFVEAAELYVGAATVDITPSEPVALSGQRRLRIATGAETPISVTALALESRDGAKPLDQAVFVSCDLVFIEEKVLATVRTKLERRLPELNPLKVVLSATHTHTAPVTSEDQYAVPISGVMQPAAFVELLTDRIAEAVIKSWQSRQLGKVGWGQGQAVIGQNRRALYNDGTAKMYGRTDDDGFRGFEGYEDHSLDVLYFWVDDTLLATAINVPCPSQEVESSKAVNADFWHPVRESLRQRHGKNLHVLGWTGAAGDQSPHLMLNKASDTRMRELRGLSRLDELARRIVASWEDTLEAAQRDQHDDVEFVHRVSKIELPMRQVLQSEAVAAQAEMASAEGDPANLWSYRWHKSVVDRYDAQQAGSPGVYTMELHVVRLGDVAIATNAFELFTDFGIQIKARSPAVQTFLIQLAGPGTYLPTERAVQGGSYSAIVQSSVVGPEGGQVLVERTVEVLQSLWPKP